MKKGSEILKDKVIIGLNLMTEFDNAIIKMTSIRAIAFINSKLEGTVVVPEEDWLQQEKRIKNLEVELETTKTMASPKFVAKLQTKLQTIIETLEKECNACDKPSKCWLGCKVTFSVVDLKERLELRELVDEK